jgi:DnaJ-domain-containing protein 1
MSSLFRRFGRLVRASFLSNDLPTPDASDAFDTSSQNYAEPQPKSGQPGSSGPRNAPPPPAGPEAGYYAALELPAGASFEDIKRAYKTLMKKYHPDRFHNEPQKKQFAEAVTQKLNEAYAYFEKKHGK